jgi:hypothetical protein
VTVGSVILLELSLNAGHLLFLSSSAGGIGLLLLGLLGITELDNLLGGSLSLCFLFSSLGFGFSLLLGFFSGSGLLGGSSSGLFVSLCLLFCFFRSLFFGSLGFSLSLSFFLL